ncbi:DUF1127 domain-containing protein [Pseudomonas oligotrophica]|uniref:DUF1127 domain-containing protein n=1 Tax=Pseudomonas oligotrophica TaxID=2912055 RepID=UPI001F450CCC|nr:DUF1127 domain-containing protein [Pseudomonas oligotrophica]MCF7200842.1 DUF1127 domain-containing protein [Pseudomonas oligotrophica]
MQRTLPRLRTARPVHERLHALLALLRLWQQRSRTRHQLAALDAHQLADTGISPAARRAELDKPFWR